MDLLLLVHIIIVILHLEAVLCDYHRHFFLVCEEIVVGVVHYFGVYHPLVVALKINKVKQTFFKFVKHKPG